MFKNFFSVPPCLDIYVFVWEATRGALQRDRSKKNLENAQIYIKRIIYKKNKETISKSYTSFVKLYLILKINK